jgi:aspartate kinase
MSAMVNGHMRQSERIAHTEEKHLPGGWVVLKFGGTSVGRFAENIAGIVRYVTPAHAHETMTHPHAT